MASSSKRRVSDLEKRIHQKCLAAPSQIMTNKEMMTAFQDDKARVDALNFLLAAQMIKLLKDDSGISYKAVQIKEAKKKSELENDEAMILSRIEESGTEGIWIKTIQKKTELASAVVNRCLKSLEQKQAIKAIKSVKYPTRKMYMLYHLEPSVEVTGGPWYTDHELDNEFIRMLCDACFQWIAAQSFPKAKSSLSDRALFSVSQSHKYPTATQIHAWVKSSGITDVTLSIEHIEMLLSVLVFDGRIEKLPAIGAAMWDMGALDDPSSSEDEKKTKKKRKRRKDDADDAKARKKRKVSSRPHSDEEDDSEDAERGKKRKSKKRAPLSDSDSSDSDGRSRSSARKRKRFSKAGESASSSESEGHHRKKSKKIKQRSPSPDEFVDVGSGNVYRATRRTHDTIETLTVASNWSQAPCSKCVQFEFCNDQGPVNARDCVYYTDWLQQAEGVAQLISF